MNMIKTLGFLLTIGAGITLTLGVLSVFGSMNMGNVQWPMIILGTVFFFAGIGLLKYRKDTDAIQADNN